VYAAAFHSGNRTTSISDGVVCNGGSGAAPCEVFGTTYPGGLPAPNKTVPPGNVTGPETGLIVKFNPSNSRWEDRLGRNWTPAVRFDLPDRDVFTINANAAVPNSPSFFVGVGTIIFNMIANPVSGKVYVTNTEARNEVRFEGPGGGGSTVRGHLHEARITILDGATVTPRHLNKHINYNVVPAPVSVRDASLATPLGMAITSDGATLYLAAFGSSKVGVFDTAQLEANTFTPSPLNHITVAGGGPSGLALDEANDRLYVYTRFDNAISVIDTTTNAEIDHLPVYNPEPAIVRNGRSFLYDAVETSSNGEAACAACHIFGDFDSLAWDLGNPDDVVLNDPNPRRVDDVLAMSFPDFHPMKGPMTTQSLRGMANHGPMHWRGDRTGGNDEPNAVPDGGAFNEQLAFKKFNVAFDGLIGRGSQLTAAQMQAFTDFILQVTYPPNPIRALDNSLTFDEDAGRTFFFGPLASDVFEPCNGCHVLSIPGGFFGSDGRMSFEFEPQMLKIPHLRNMYQKVGMFGMPAVPFFNPGDNGHTGNQVRGFGFLHDGSVDTLFRFHNSTVFNQDNPAGFPIPNPGGFPAGAAGDTLRAQVEAFMLAFDSNLAPIVGQQITLTNGNAAVVGARISLLLARAAVGECEVVVKGTLAGDPRGWVSTNGIAFSPDRNDEDALTDAQLRAQAISAGQERTYTCVPPGDGIRAGVDRDEDGWWDQTEIDLGADPADPFDTPAGPIPTTTTTTTASTTTTTSTTAPPVLIQTKSLTLRSDSFPPLSAKAQKVLFRSGTIREPGANRIVPPAPGGPGDPRLFGGEVTVYNSAGLTDDVVVSPLSTVRWDARGSTYIWKGPFAGPILKVIVKPDKITVKGGRFLWPYSLNEPQQGRIAVRLRLGSVSWCADAPAKSAGNPPSTLRFDTVDRFQAKNNSPAPASCPPVPTSGSPGGAFLDDAPLPAPAG
jgi:YVTN family beta-propeller protein